MPKAKHSKMSLPLARQCRSLVYRMAAKHGVPPVCITAHWRSTKADAARYEVWRIMIGEMGMTRQLVAKSFGRDRRRLRKSVIGV